MSQDTNLPIINPADTFDQKVQDYFANYTRPSLKLSENEYSVVKSFFLGRTSNNEAAAAALTAAVIEAANQLDVYIVDVIAEFEDSNDLKSAIPTFLNLSRRSSSLLGYEVNISPNVNVSRQVEA